MAYSKALIVALTSTLLFSSGCLQTQNNSSEGFVAEGDDYFKAAVEAFEMSCSTNACHGFHMMTEAELISTGRAIPGDPENSPIYYRMKDSAGSRGPKTMPTVGSLSTPDREAVREWIENLDP